VEHATAFARRAFKRRAVRTIVVMLRRTPVLNSTKLY
jgi:hypothetical protein